MAANKAGVKTALLGLLLASPACLISAENIHNTASATAHTTPLSQGKDWYINFKEPLINLDEFWQRQISRIKAYELLMLIALEVSITQSLGIWLSPTG
jgi:hypothetical protein